MNDPRWVDNRSFHISSTPYVVHIALTANTSALCRSSGPMVRSFREFACSDDSTIVGKP